MYMYTPVAHLPFRYLAHTDNIKGEVGRKFQSTDVECSIHKGVADIVIQTPNVMNEYVELLKEATAETKGYLHLAAKSIVTPEKPSTNEQALVWVALYRCIPKLKKLVWKHSKCGKRCDTLLSLSLS